MKFIRWYFQPIGKTLCLRGRTSRAEFLRFFFCHLLIGAAIAGIENTYSAHFYATTAYVILLLPTCFALCARRLHDLGFSARWLWVFVFPVIGAVLFLYWAVTEGQQRPNRFGRNPVD